MPGRAAFRLLLRRSFAAGWPLQDHLQGAPHWAQHRKVTVLEAILDMASNGVVRNGGIQHIQQGLRLTLHSHICFLHCIDTLSGKFRGVGEVLKLEERLVSHLRLVIVSPVAERLFPKHGRKCFGFSCGRGTQAKFYVSGSLLWTVICKNIEHIVCYGRSELEECLHSTRALYSIEIEFRNCWALCCCHCVRLHLHILCLQQMELPRPTHRGSPHRE